ASQATDRVLKVDPDNVEAHTIRARALFASAIEDRRDRQARVAAGKQSVNHLRQVAARGPDVEQAEGLMALIERRPADAIPRLTAGRADGIGNRDLFLGWAHSA